MSWLDRLRAPPLVSIVIASYNYARFLDAAIASARTQTYANVEILVVDDGSTDGSVAVARRHPITVLTQANRGVAIARNRGARKARGRYLVFLDADDILEPTFVARGLQALAGQPRSVAYAYTQVRYFGAEERVEPSHVFDRDRLLLGNFIAVSTVLRRRAFFAAGGFDPTLSHYEDWDLWLRMLARGFEGRLVEEPLLRYRRHGMSRNVIDVETEERHKREISARYFALRPPWLGVPGAGWVNVMAERPWGAGLFF